VCAKVDIGARGCVGTEVGALTDHRAETGTAETGGQGHPSRGRLLFQGAVTAVVHGKVWLASAIKGRQGSSPVAA
jgi:hypothetical protein